jgi:PAS domain S-box-containing protein
MAALHSLKFRIALTIFALECVMMVVALWQTSASQTDALRTQQVAAQDAVMTLAARVARNALLTDEMGELRFYFEDLQRDPNVERVLLANAQGRVVGSSDIRQLGQPSPEFAAGPQTEWRTVTIDNATGKLGTLAVQFSSRELLRAQDDARKLGIAIAAVGMTLIALVGLGLGILMTRKLGHLAQVAQRMAQGDRDVRAKLEGQDELAGLGRAFDEMADAVARQEHQLRAEREYNELLLASTAEAIVGVDGDGHCTFANPACLRMLGYEREGQLIGRDVMAMIGRPLPDRGLDPAAAGRARLNLREGRLDHADDEVCARADGTTFPIERWSHPMHRHGELIGAVLTFVDIAERRQTEQALLLSETRLRQAVRATRSGIFDHDHVTDTIYWSPEQRANYGFTADEPITLQGFLDRVHPDDLAAIGPAVQRAHDPAGDGLFDVEHRIIRCDGQLRWLATRSITIFEGTGAERHPARTVGAVVDVTERKLAELALRDERNFTNAVLGNAGALVLVLDHEGRIRRFNRAAEQVSGRSFAEVEGRFPWDLVLPPEVADEVRMNAFEALAKGPQRLSGSYRNQWMHTNGERRWIDWTNTLLLDEAGRMQFMVTIGVDVTERRAAEERIRVALREKEVLLKEIYHRVKNNLQMVVSLLTLQSRNAGHDAARSALDDGANRIKSMALVHEQLYRSGDLTVIAFADYIQQLLHHIAEAQGESGGRVTLRSEIVPVDIGIETAVPLGLIVNELVTNAYKHAFPGGRKGSIFLRLQPLNDGQLEFSVVDDGVGLPSDFDAARSDSLGLRLVFSLAEQLGGNLVHAAAGDAGSRFAIRFKLETQEHSRLLDAGSSMRRVQQTSTTPA